MQTTEFNLLKFQIQSKSYYCIGSSWQMPIINLTQKYHIAWVSARACVEVDSESQNLK